MLSVRLDDAAEAALEVLQERTGMTQSEIVERVLTDSAQQVRPSAYDLGRDLFGRFAGPADLSSRRKEHHLEAVSEKLRGRRQRPVAGAVQRGGRTPRGN